MVFHCKVFLSKSLFQFLDNEFASFGDKRLHERAIVVNGFEIDISFQELHQTSYLRKHVGRLAVIVKEVIQEQPSCHFVKTF